MEPNNINGALGNSGIFSGLNNTGGQAGTAAGSVTADQIRQAGPSLEQQATAIAPIFLSILNKLIEQARENAS